MHRIVTARHTHFFFSCLLQRQRQGGASWRVRDGASPCSRRRSHRPARHGGMRDRYLEHMAVRTTRRDHRGPHGLPQLLHQVVRGPRHRAPGDVTKPIIDRYQRWLYHYRNPDGKPLTFHSQYTHLSPIKSWFQWLARENYILFNPASELDMPRLNRSLPKHILTAAEVDQVINGADANTALGMRNRAILETFYSTGLRRLEVVQLKLYDVDLERATVMVRDGKWHKDRFVPVGERAVLWLNKYLADVRPLLAPPREDTLFLTNAGEPFTPDSMTQLARDYVEKAKLPGGKRGACHVFRHTMATLMLEGGADIRYIQAMLGHADLSTTQIYTHVGIRNLSRFTPPRIRPGCSSGPDHHRRKRRRLTPPAPRSAARRAHPRQHPG